MHTSLVTYLIAGMAIVGAGSTASGQATAPETRPNRIRIEYVPPQNPLHQSIYEMIKAQGALERMQEIYSPVRLREDLTLRTVDCGLSNAWYQRATVTICYEYLADIRKMVPMETTPDGLTAGDAVIGQFVYTVAHEMGHALFDLLDIPLFGRPEDAADGFSAYMMLMLGKKEARRLILGAAYSYNNYLQNPRVSLSTKAFADEHGAPWQRYYNLLCIAYGADKEMFADFVDKGYLPAERVRTCRTEYGELNFAFEQLIKPHLDEQLAARVMQKDWLAGLDPGPPRQSMRPMPAPK